MARAWRMATGVVLLALFTIIFGGCALERVSEASPGEINQPRASDQELAPTREEKQPSSSPTGTAVPSPASTTLPENKNEPVSTEANADVLFVSARQEANNTWHFTVTVEHPDTGWEDYADGWDVVLPDGSVARPDQGSPFTRLLLHPHEAEQPFTRSQGGIVIAPGINEVTVRAHDLVDGFGGRVVVVNLLSESGPDYEVKHLSQ